MPDACAVSHDVPPLQVFVQIAWPASYHYQTARGLSLHPWGKDRMARVASQGPSLVLLESQGRVVRARERGIGSEG